MTYLEDLEIMVKNIGLANVVNLLATVCEHQKYSAIANGNIYMEKIWQAHQTDFEDYFDEQFSKTVDD